MYLLNNIIASFSYLKSDFLGFNLNPTILVTFFISILVSMTLFFLSYCLGKKIFKLFKTPAYEFNYLIFIAIGYVFISTVIAILGFMRQLTPLNISSFLVISTVVALGIPFQIVNNAKDLILSIKETLNSYDRKLLSIILLFVALGVINLINPEIREDQYHTDYARIYLKTHTILLPPKEDLQVSASPMLPEMYYLVGLFLYSKEIPRYINFFFYILVILTLIRLTKVNEHKFGLYAPLLFASAPVIIKETSSGYTDFTWIYLMLLSTLVLIEYKKSTFKYILSGFLSGSFVAGKLWTIVLSPTFFILSYSQNLKNKKKNIYALIFLVSFAIPLSIWLIRAYVLTGNPLFPAFGNNLGVKYPLTEYLGINLALFNPKYFLNVFSPAFFAGIIFLLYRLKDNIKILLKLEITKIFLIILLTYLLVNYPYGRYLIGLYIFFIFIASLGIQTLAKRFKWVDALIKTITLLVFAYYLISSILVLLYAFGMADQNKYLSRILIRDNSSYYDFGHKFNKHISKNDFVAMYNFHGYYYADFNYIDTNYLLKRKGDSFSKLKENGVTKLIIRGGDIKWFCKQFELSDCDDKSNPLISEYNTFPFYYMYVIK